MIPIAKPLESCSLFDASFYCSSGNFLTDETGKVDQVRLWNVFHLPPFSDQPQTNALRCTNRLENLHLKRLSRTKNRFYGKMFTKTELIRTLTCNCWPIRHTSVKKYVPDVENIVNLTIFLEFQDNWNFMYTSCVLFSKASETLLYLQRMVAVV